MGPTDKPLIAVLDYGIGNLRSAEKSLQRVGADARLTADHGLIADADAVVLPGVGAFKSCMAALTAAGLADIAAESADSDRPFLGICVGMQMLYAKSEESPGIAGLGVLDGTVQLIPGDVKRPQMQWNVLDIVAPGPMFAGLEDPAWVYFVHSYAVLGGDHVAATCAYGGDLVAAVVRDNLWATQFHPEKSSRNGLQLLTNFVDSVTR